MRRFKFTITKDVFGKYYAPEEDDEYIGDYIVREWTFGEREEVLQLSSEQIVDEAGKFSVRMKSRDYRVNQMLFCLKLAPFDVTVDNIENLPNSIADKILKHIGEVCEELDDDEIKK